MDQHWSWNDFSVNMTRFSRDAETRFAALLDFVGRLDELAARLVARETGTGGERPQDYVACVLAVRSFRLSVSSIQLAVSGYTDACPNLYRTNWEISVRLLDILQHPVEGALGYLLQGASEELATARAEDQCRGDHSSGAQRAGSRISALNATYDQYASFAAARGLDPRVLQQKHGKLNYRAVCDRHGLEKSYQVNYAFASGYVHEKNWATREFVSDADGERRFNFAPVSGARAVCIADALVSAFIVVQLAAVVVQDSALATDTAAALEGLAQLTDDDVAMGLDFA